MRRPPLEFCPHRVYKTLSTRTDMSTVSCIPFILEFQLKLETFHLHFALTFMLEDFCVRFTVLRGRNVPSCCSLCWSLVRAQHREIANNITIRTTATKLSQKNKASNE